MVKFAQFIQIISHGPLKAREIQEQLGIDRRTSARYARTLKDAGFDIRSSTGAEGGYWLKGMKQNAL